MNPDPLRTCTGEYRSCGAAETFQKVAAHLVRLGITRVARQTDLDRIGIPVWCAYTPNAKAIVIAQGKGVDDDAARTSAVMEAIERSVASDPACDRITESITSIHMRGQCLDTLDCLLAARADLITPHEPVTWANSRDLLKQEPLWVPFEAVHLDRSLVSARYWQSSDGLASGNTPEEAVLHGLLERVERDALTLWQVTPPKKRFTQRVDAARAGDATLGELLDKIEAAGLVVALFDITSDVAIPCMVALIGPRRRHASPALRHVEITLGAGASLLPATAAIRAVAEAVQSRMTFIAGARDDLLPAIFSRAIDHTILEAFDQPFSRQLGGTQPPHPQTTAEALTVVLNRLRAGGISQIYAADLAPAWLPVSVVKVLVPQLENPDGDRRQRFGVRAISRALQ